MGRDIPIGVPVTDRTNSVTGYMAVTGRKRAGRSKGHRVQIWTETGVVSVYPEDARKAAMQLLDLADECEGR